MIPDLTINKKDILFTTKTDVDENILVLTSNQFNFNSNNKICIYRNKLIISYVIHVSCIYKDFAIKFPNNSIVQHNNDDTCPRQLLKKINDDDLDRKSVV